MNENFISTIFGEELSKAASIVACTLMLFISFFTAKNKKITIDKFILLTLILAIEHLCITFLLKDPQTNITNANNLITPYSLIAYSFLLLMIKNISRDKENFALFFKTAAIVTSCTVIMNLLFTKDFQLANNLITFTEALNTGYNSSRTWLFGHRNMIFIQHILWILCTYLYFYIKQKKYTRTFIIQIIFTLLVSIISWNSTMMVVTIIIAAFYLFKNMPIVRKIAKIKTYIIAFLTLEIGIVFMRIQDIFSDLIVSILHRNLSFTGRTAIWDYYIEQFNTSPIQNKLFGNFGKTELSVNSHNMILGTLSFSGIFGLVIYSCLAILGIKNLSKNNSECSKFLSIIIFALLINSLMMEFYIQLIFVFYLGYKVNDINNLLSGGNTSEK